MCGTHLASMREIRIYVLYFVLYNEFCDIQFMSDSLRKGAYSYDSNARRAHEIRLCAPDVLSSRIDTLGCQERVI
jgi:hypothetical protein